MSTNERAIPTGSQTVGPYFRIGLEYLANRTTEVSPGEEAIEIRGRVLDGEGAPVPDAMLEFWAPPHDNSHALPYSIRDAHPQGFVRVATDTDGKFVAVVARPVANAVSDGTMQSPHLLVLVFARGLLRHLITRVYFEDERGNTADPVLGAVPANRRGTLIAQLEGHQTNTYLWNVILQGQDETVFFAW